MQKRLSRLSRRSIVVAIVGFAFAAAAGVGLAQITAGPSPTAAAAGTTTQSTTDLTTSSVSSDFAEDDDELEKSQKQATSSSITQSTTSTSLQASTSDDEGNGQEKVGVCHVTGSGKSHTINIAEPAVAAHTAHGDTKGACAETTSPKTSTTAPVKPRYSTRTQVKKAKAVHVATHVSHAKPKHVSHARPAQKTHGSSAHESHGNSAGAAVGNGHGKK